MIGDLFETDSIVKGRVQGENTNHIQRQSVYREMRVQYYFPSIQFQPNFPRRGGLLLGGGFELGDISHLFAFESQQNLLHGSIYAPFRPLQDKQSYCRVSVECKPKSSPDMHPFQGSQ